MVYGKITKNWKGKKGFLQARQDMKYASSPLTANKKGIPTVKHILAFRPVALAAALIGLSTALRADESSWCAVARRAAADGTVLLKNEAAALPLAEGTKVALFGAPTLIVSGGGSAEVTPSRKIDLAEGLEMAGLKVVKPAEGPEAGIVLITRKSREGRDNPDKAFALSPAELASVAEAKRVCGKAVVVVNAGHAVGLKPLKEGADCDAILYTWFPGQEGGAALGEIIAGRVNPSGRLADTLAAKLADWPGSANFRKSKTTLGYPEGGEVGYRYFNTKAPDKIVYPFGWGLSYTTFSESEPEADAATGDVLVTVSNTGARAGRHSVLYFEGGELLAYAKTGTLAPGASEVVRLKPWRGAPRLEPLPADPEIEAIAAKLTLEEKVTLCCAMPPAITRGTAGVGNMPQYGIPNAQTTDGPNGVRRCGTSVCQPSGAHLAQTFDDALAEEIGRAIGEEAKARNFDILLGPGLNIHRFPLCGRNFEYFSEDPIVSGKMAAAYVRGVQSTGTAATLKHFCCNSREWNRKGYSAEIDETTLRNIYLKGFEIAVKEGRPRCVMTAYNKLNGSFCGESEKILNGILRGEWGFDGLVMSDWRAESTIWKQVNAGCDVYMPYGYPEKVALALEKAKTGELSAAALEASVRRVLREAKNSHRYRAKDFGPVCTIAAAGETVVPAKESTCISSTWTFWFEDPVEGWGHSGLGKDPRGNDVFVQYELDVAEAGDYDVFIRACSVTEKSSCSYEYDGKKTDRFAIPKTNAFGEIGPVRLTLKKGRSPLRVWFYVDGKLSPYRENGSKFTRLRFVPVNGGARECAENAE